VRADHDEVEGEVEVIAEADGREVVKCLGGAGDEIGRGKIAKDADDRKDDHQDDKGGEDEVAGADGAVEVVLAHQEDEDGEDEFELTVTPDEGVEDLEWEDEEEGKAEQALEWGVDEGVDGDEDEGVGSEPGECDGVIGEGGGQDLEGVEPAAEETEGIEEEDFEEVRGSWPFERERGEGVGEPGGEGEVVTEEEEGEAEVGIEEGFGEGFPIAEGAHDGGRVGEDVKGAEGEVEGVGDGGEVDEREPIEVVEAAADEEGECSKEEEGEGEGDNGSGSAGGEPAAAEDMLVVEEEEDQQQHQRGKKRQHGQEDAVGPPYVRLGESVLQVHKFILALI